MVWGEAALWWLPTALVALLAALSASTALLLTQLKIALFSPVNLRKTVTSPPKPPGLRPPNPQPCLAFT